MQVDENREPSRSKRSHPDDLSGSSFASSASRQRFDLQGQYGFGAQQDAQHGAMDCLESASECNMAIAGAFPPRLMQQPFGTEQVAGIRTCYEEQLVAALHVAVGNSPWTVTESPQPDG